MITVNTLRVKENKVYGSVKWVHYSINDISVTVTFEGLYDEDLSEVFKRDIEIIDVPVVTEDIIIEGDHHKLYVSKRISELRYIQALVEIFGAAFKAVEE